MTSRPEWTRRAALVLILVGAAVLRFNAVGLGNEALTFQIDEDHNVQIPLTLSWNNLNPHAFYLPSLLWYLLFALDRLVFWVGRQYGFVKDWADLRQLFEQTDPLLFFLLGRSLSAALGTATVGLVYFLGRRLFSTAHGLLAAAFLACAFLHVRDSALAMTDAPTTFFVVLSLLGTAAVLREGRVWHYLLAGGAAGLATVTKYNAALVLVALVVAHWLRADRSRSSIRRIVTAPRLLGALLLAAFVFVALDPYLFLDWPHSRTDLTWAARRFEQEGQVIGEYLDVGPGWWYHLSVSLRYGMGLGLLGLAMVGVARTLWRREPAGLVLLSFAAGFYLVMGSAKLIFVRYMTPLLPALCLFAAMALLSLTGLLKWPRVRPWVAAALSVLAVAEPLYASAAYGRLVHHVDTRVKTAEFIRVSLPPGTQVATYGSDMVWRSTIPRFLPTLYAKHPQQSWAEVIAVLESRNIHYFLTHHSGLDAFSPTIPELELALGRSGTLIQEFSPYDPRTRPRPVYDRDDPYYFPIGGFQGVRRPGPLVRLYRLR